MEGFMPELNDHSKFREQILKRDLNQLLGRIHRVTANYEVNIIPMFELLNKIYIFIDDCFKSTIDKKKMEEEFKRNVLQHYKSKRETS